MTPGTRLGSYEVLGSLGAGGMGEVYRARDLRLGREVALKILPDALTGDPDRIARFEREARLLASLHHPHIATLFGFEDLGPVRALSMELAEGPTLAEKPAARGPLEFGEARRIAVQIALALEAAHDNGVVHRDLEPANIRITPDGAVKLLDFGLAKALGEGTRAAGCSQSPTVTDAGTRAGVVLGTAAYMSPEQPRGLALDERTDVWSFGCVLFELLTGRAASGGRTVADVTSAVLNREPDWGQLPADRASRLRGVLTRCLSKEAKNRFRSIADVRFALEDLDAAVEPALPPRVPARGLSVLPWLVAAIAVVVAVVQWGGAPNPSPSPLSEAFAAEQLTYDAGLTTMPAVSREGRLLAYASDRVKTGTARLPAVRRAVSQAIQSPATGRWTSDGVVFSDGRDIWRLRLDLRSGRVSGSIERLTAGAEQYRHPSVAGNGAITFGATSILRVIERAALSDDTPSQ